MLWIPRPWHEKLLPASLGCLLSALAFPAALPLPAPAPAPAPAPSLPSRPHTFRRTHVHICAHAHPPLERRSHPAGVWANKKRGVAAGFAISDFVVVLEDDIVLAPDALRWFEWHVTSGLIFDRPEIALSTCWSGSFPHDPDAAVEGHDWLVAHHLGLLDKYTARSWATPWGWAAWRRTWDAVGANWTGRDVNIAKAVQARGWLETMPVVARCNNIGSFGAHKKGETVGHIHRRAITSASFSGTERCRYTELRNRSDDGSGPAAREDINRWVRNGIFRDRRMMSYSLPDLRALLNRYITNHPVPQWNSTC